MAKRGKIGAIWRRLPRAQTMTEYALILTAVALVALLGYELMGRDLSNNVSRTNSTLTSS